MKSEPYFIGLDCGTGSVGWAVTDENYKILRMKGKSAIGSRLFETAAPAAERRAARSSRRRTRRTRSRIKLLEQIFSEEIAKVDPDFYIRLRESFFLEEDKEGLAVKSKNTLFNDNGYTDKDFHKEFPTIWHLRQAILAENRHFDIRLYYLAIHHIIKHRGHFLYDGSMTGSGNSDELFHELVKEATNYSIFIDDDAADAASEIIKSKQSKRDKKRQLLGAIFLEREDLSSKRAEELAGLLAGLKITPRKIFEDDIDGDAMKYSFADDDFDDKRMEIEQEIGVDNIRIFEIAKKIYDFGILSGLLKGHKSISSAMVENYNIHQRDLKELKAALKPFPEDYDLIFKSAKSSDGKTPTYAAYIGKAYTEDKGGRRKSFKVSQEAINDQIHKILASHGITGPLLDRAANKELLPKQKGQAKGTIPQQLHHNDLEAILERLCHDYPSFAKAVSGEPEEYNTKAKKIAKIHNFRIPYYCGPIVSKDKSEFSWADEEINQLVYPWNFSEIVNLDARANNFIRRMTNQCTYLLGDNTDVLPKASILYQKYMVLNELNNLKVNGRRIDDVAIKQQIFERGFVQGELPGNVTLKTLSKWLVMNGFLQKDDELSGSSETKILPKYSTHRDFCKILGNDYAAKYAPSKIEKAIELITILGEERKMLARKLEELLECSKDDAERLSKLSYSGWGRFCMAFLTKITSVTEDGLNRNIIDALYYTNHNLMELLGGEFGFSTAIEEYNRPHLPESGNVTYRDVQNLYCSPAVKRTIWQSLRVLKEIIGIKKSVPSKIFLEVTREESDNSKKGYTLSRQKQLHDLYTQIKHSPEATELLRLLDSKEPRDLQNKKLYLYFTQMGKCAYTGERIDLESLENYDIDHIYPRSLTKDDSITRNLVLVKAEYNREKTNRYPINAEWRERMCPIWTMWRAYGLITKEKYDRLTRSNLLTIDELSGFISRQIVETSQAVKAIRGLINRAYPDTKVVMVKGSQVSDFRHYFGYGEKDKSGNYIRQPKPEFIKVRTINDLHHAKDAYLNIVVGNVIDETFTSDPYQWVKRRGNQGYSLNSRALWRDKRESGSDYIKGWSYSDTIDTVSKYLKRNDVLWTRMSCPRSGAVSDLLIVGKSDNSSEILPIKKCVTENGKFDPVKYGGYTDVASAYFALVEESNGKRSIVQIPIIAAKNPDDFVSKEYPGAKMLKSIYPNAILRLNGFPVHITGKTGNSFVGCPALQTIFHPEACAYIAKVLKVVDKNSQLKGKYIINPERDSVTAEHNTKLLDLFNDKLQKLFVNAPGVKSKIPEIVAAKDKFVTLGINEQCNTLKEYLKIFNSSTKYANLSSYVPKASTVGRVQFSQNISNLESAELIQQSPCGFFEKNIDLKTYKGN